MLSFMTCAAPTLLITFTPLIGVMLASLVGIMPFGLISGTVSLVVHVVALVEVRTSSLPKASLAMTSSGGRRWSRCTPLIDLDYGHLQISLDRDSGSLFTLFMATAMLALGVLNTCWLSHMSKASVRSRWISRWPPAATSTASSSAFSRSTLQALQSAFLSS
jgi:hypothetical protein